MLDGYDSYETFHTHAHLPGPQPSAFVDPATQQEEARSVLPHAVQHIAWRVATRTAGVCVCVCERAKDTCIAGGYAWW